MSELAILRPKGTVEVTCSHPGCGVAWWVGPLDPRLPGPFDCGADHRWSRIVYGKFALAQAKHGVYFSGIGGTDPEDPCGCGKFPKKGGYANVYSRDYRRQGVFFWRTPADVSSADAIVEAIEWDSSKWPPEVVEADKGFPRLDYYAAMEASPGRIWCNSYELFDTKSVRQYTFVPCSRCGIRMKVDARDPSFKPQGAYVIGGIKGPDDLPEPAWWGRTFLCEDAMDWTGNGPQPCRVVNGEALRTFEQSGPKWTIWNSYGRPHERGSILFYDKATNAFGLLVYRDLTPFATAQTIADSIRWGTILDAYGRLQGSYLSKDDEGYGNDSVRQVLSQLVAHQSVS